MADGTLVNETSDKCLLKNFDFKHNKITVYSAKASVLRHLPERGQWHVWVRL